MKEPKRIKVSTLIAIVLSFTAFIAMITLLQWAYASSNVLEIKNDKNDKGEVIGVPVNPHQVRSGEIVYLNIDFCKSAGATGRTDVHLVGAAGPKIEIDWPTDKQEAGCDHYPAIAVPIPGHTPTDVYYAEFVICYDINPLKNNKCTKFISQKFKVIDRID